MKYLAIFIAAAIGFAGGLACHKQPIDDPMNWRGAPNVTYRIKVPIAPEDQRSFEAAKFKAQIAAIDKQLPLETTTSEVFGRTLRPCPPNCDVAWINKRTSPSSEGQILH
jgi:hypothetical protein